MKPTLRNLFIKIEIVEVPNGLCSSIVERVILAERNAAKKQCAFKGLLSVGSLVGGFFVFDIVLQSFVQSGFYQYLQLIFIGDTDILVYWREFGLTLVESVPLVGSVVLLSVLGVFLWSAGGAARNARVLFTPTVV